MIKRILAANVEYRPPVNPAHSVANAEQAIREANVLVDVREADEFAAGHLPDAPAFD